MLVQVVGGVTERSAWVDTEHQYGALFCGTSVYCLGAAGCLMLGPLTMRQVGLQQALQDSADLAVGWSDCSQQLYLCLFCFFVVPGMHTALRIMYRMCMLLCRPQDIAIHLQSSMCARGCCAAMSFEAGTPSSHLII